MFHPKKRFGQHFLLDSNTLERMANAINPKSQDHMIEIGPGQGALTDYLLGNVQKLDLIEIDKSLVASLQQKYEKYPAVHIFSKDVLKFSWTEAKSSSPDKLRLVGNLPYNISTPLLVSILDEIECFQDMYFLLQKEVAERLCAPVGHKNYGRLSIMAQFYCQVELLFFVGPEVFNPPPKVWSAFVHLMPKPQLMIEKSDRIDFFQLVKMAFAHRRKTLGNNLKSVISADTLSTIGIDPIWRPQQLSVNDFVKITQHLKSFHLVQPVKSIQKS